MIATLSIFLVAAFVCRIDRPRLALEGGQEFFDTSFTTKFVLVACDCALIWTSVSLLLSEGTTVESLLFTITAAIIVSESFLNAISIPPLLAYFAFTTCVVVGPGTWLVCASASVASACISGALWNSVMERIGPTSTVLGAVVMLVHATHNVWFTEAGQLAVAWFCPHNPPKKRTEVSLSNHELGIPIRYSDHHNHHHHGCDYGY